MQPTIKLPNNVKKIDRDKTLRICNANWPLRKVVLILLNQSRITKQVGKNVDE